MNRISKSCFSAGASLVLLSSVLAGCNHDEGPAPVTPAATPDTSSANASSPTAAPTPSTSASTIIKNDAPKQSGTMAYDRDGAPHTCTPLSTESVGNAPLCATPPSPPDRELYKACQDAGFKILKCGECKELCSGMAKVTAPAH